MKPGGYADRQAFEKELVTQGYDLKTKQQTGDGNILVAERYLTKSDDDEVGSPCWKVAWFIERDEKIMIGRVLYMPVWHKPNGVWLEQTEEARIGAAQADAMTFLNDHERAGHG